MEISFCSHPNCNEVIATKCCTWHDSCAVVACANLVAIWWTTTELQLKWNFHRLWIGIEKSLVSDIDPFFQLEYVFVDQRVLFKVAKAKRSRGISRIRCHFRTQPPLTEKQLNSYTVLPWWHYNCHWGMRYSLQLAGITLMWLINLITGWYCFVSQCIVGSPGRWEFPPFFKSHWYSPCTALTACRCLSLGLYKETVKDWFP